MTSETMPTETVSRSPVAIIGLGCVLPDAPDVKTFWDNLLAGRSSVREVPKTRWDPDLFWDEDRTALDRTYTKIGAFVEDDAFDGIIFRMPPKMVEQVDPSQRWALSATREALLDAGYTTGLKGDEGKPFDRQRCAVILGNAMGGEMMKLQTKNAYWIQVETALRGDPDFQGLPAEKQDAVLERARKTYQAGVPPITEDSMPGALSNVAAGRIANVFDLGGKNFTTDAACASSFAALDAAIDTLDDEEADLVLWGGTDRSMDITPYVEFSKIGALSPDGSRPFDKDANGFVMGEGCAMFLLKRLEDAERDGDTVYGVVRGVGASSDGKGKGITAPNPKGQVLAVRRAYEDAGIDPGTVGYLEAHGTSTPVGDPVELESVQTAFKELWAEPAETGSIRVGSVKSNLGHLKSAAGAVGMLKAVMAVKEGVIPPSINVQELNPRIDWDQSPFQVATTKTDWPQPEDLPRRAGISSFGFGGTNFHIVLEQYVPGRIRVDKRVVQAVDAKDGDAKTALAGQTSHPAATAAASASTQGQAGQQPPTATVLDTQAFQAHMDDHAALEPEPLVLDGDKAAEITPSLPQSVAYPETGEGPRVRDLFTPLTHDGVQAERRVGVAVQDLADLPKKMALAQKAAADPNAARLAFNQGVFLGQGAPQGKVAFLFPGQGTQYVNMGRDLARKYAVVQHTFEEADEALFDELDGVKLTDILWPDPDTPEARKASEERLRLTEFTQPAVLAMDVALLRLLKQWGIKPDMVAGHSLGEYGALVAAGVMPFQDALHAVAARGREMATVDVEDLGKMAAVPADWETVAKAIEGVEEYVIPANKNCSKQTVLAGSSAGVDQAVAALKEQGLDAQYLPVSAAFHSDIVAPASAPLRKVLGRLDIQAPKVTCLSNVGAVPYPDDPDQIRDNLAKQIAHPVEWIDIMERMYDEGVRTFIEVGPKRALTGFCMDLLKEHQDAVAICANHPKKGGIQHINELFAFLGAWGFRPTVPELQDGSVYTATYRDPAAPFRTVRSTPAGGQTSAGPQASSAQQAAPTPHASSPVTSSDGAAATDKRLDVITDGLQHIVEELRAMNGKAAGAAPTDLARPVAEAPPSAATGASEEAEALRQKMAAFGIDLDDIGVSGASVGLPGADKPLFSEDNWDRILRGDNMIDNVPESERRKLTSKNITRLVKSGSGEATFQVVKDIAEVIQLAGRRGGFDVTEWGVDKDFADVLDRTFQYAIAAGLEALRDAGIPLQRTYFQTSTGSYLPKEWKLPAPMRDDTGIIFASAFPGYDKLLREVSRFLADKYAGRTLDDLQEMYQSLIEVIEDDTLKGTVQDAFDNEFEKLQDDLPLKGGERYTFNRKFLFNVLSMGHAQLAQWIGARGPNTQLNAACASTTQAVAVAEDWIRTGRCKRVLVVGADDVTSDAMFEWIGAGFLASGAATTKKDVAEAALPFDARRHGMIVGMGAVGLVVESVPQTEARGMRPIARLLATRVANSAFHGSRLDVDHIAAQMQGLVEDASRRYGIAAASIAPDTVFMSHETYTPARGGSASAEIHALRAAFGAQANDVVIANTKGFTGHPQGAGIEDAIALKCLQRGVVPPIANFRDPDPELGDLRLSEGGEYNVRYALRLAAGFGSQVAMSLTELVAKEDERVADQAQYEAWLETVSGLPGAKVEVAERTLRIIDQGPPKREPQAVVKSDVESHPAAAKPEETTAPVEGTARPASAAAPTPTPPTSPSQSSPSAPTGGRGPGTDEVLEKLVDLVAEQTGYPTDMLDPDLDMEADLGIDTVKQAELFGLLRETYTIPQEEGLQIKDYPTLRKVAGYFADRLGGETSGQRSSGTVAGSAPPNNGATQDTPAPVAEAAAADDGDALSDGEADDPMPGADQDAVLETLIGLVAEQTGYPTDMLDPDLDMEADLGIDTVKQAELFGMMRESYHIPLEEGLQIKDYPTLRKVAGYFADASGAAATTSTVTASAPNAAAESRSDSGAEASAEVGGGQTRLPEHADASVATDTPAPASPAPAATGGDADDPEAVLAAVTALVADQTGYPAEMLEADLDMEADLGIDTVKQAELFGQVRERFGIPLKDGLQLKDYPTLRKVAGYVVDQQGADAGDAATAGVVAEPDAPSGDAPSQETPPGSQQTLADVPSDQPGAEEDAAQDTDPIVRRVPVLRPMVSPEQDNGLEPGPVLVLGDEDGRFTTPWKEAGFDPVRHSDGPIAGILCLGLEPGQVEGLAGALFDAAKTHQDTFRFITVVTQQEGGHGLQAPRDAHMAALAGVGKSLRKEFPDATVKVIDLHPDMVRRGTTVLEETTQGGARSEICFDRDGARHVVDVVPRSLSPEQLDVRGKAYVVAGGAQGITVEMLARIAPQGPKLLLLGRTKLPEEAATWATWDDARWKQEQQAVMAALKEAGEKVTPVAVENGLRPKKKAAEVQRNLDRLTGAGAEVLYAPVDVTDADRVKEAVAWARGHFGSIDGVVHAAGVEISKDISQKDRDQFDMVYGIKQDGLEALLAATADDDLELLCGFSSVAGRFGNIGQPDYAAGNEYVAKRIVKAAEERDIATAFTVAWGPWGEVGMATRGSIMKIMEESGVTPIPTDAGVDMFLREMATPGRRESVVAGKLGAIDLDGQVVGTAWDPVAAEAAAILEATPERYRLLSSIDTLEPGAQLTATVRMDQAEDPFARDHSIDGVPYMPGVFGLEAFAEAAQVLAPDDHVFLGASDIRFQRPLKQLKEAPVEARLEAEIVSAEEEPTVEVACRLTSQFIGPDGKPHGDPRVHFTATVRFGTDSGGLQAEDLPVCDGTLPQDRIYPPFFHGPGFQVLDAAGPLTDEESMGLLRMPTEPHFAGGGARFQSHPMVVEALFQVCGLRNMVQEQQMTLPAGIQQMDRFMDAVPDGEVRLWAQYTGTTQDGLRQFNAAAVGPDGRVILRLLGYTMVATGAMADADVPRLGDGTEARDADDESTSQEAAPPTPKASTAGAPDEARIAAATHRTAAEDQDGAPTDGPSGDDDAQVPPAAQEIPGVGVPLPEVNGFTFTAVPVQPDAGAEPIWFTTAEQEVHAGLKAPKRRDEWRAGRLAVKKAIVASVPDLQFTDVVVENDPSTRRPYVKVRGETIPLQLSLTHRDGVAIAAIGEDPLGIDLETTEARPAAWLRESFSHAEQVHLHASKNKDLEATCMWAAKEAAFKRAGTGLSADLRAHQVQAQEDGRAVVTGPLGTFGVQFYDLDGRVLAVSVPEFDPETAAGAANA